jgi:AraC-like DNA-binding protein
MFVHSSRIQKQAEYLRSVGIDPGPGFAAAGIEANESLDPDLTFTLDQFIAFMEFATERAGDLHYGLKLGMEPHMAGTMGMLCASCKNLKEAFIQGCRYFTIQGDFATIEFLGDRESPYIRYTLAPAWCLRSPETARHEVEAMFAFLVSILRINSNQSLKPLKIRLTNTPKGSEEQYVASFGIMPVFEQEYNEVHFRARDLQIPMKAFNPELNEILRSHIEKQVRRLSGKERISEKVRSILLSSLRYRFPDMDTVASRLNMSSRTLQRHLSHEKTSFNSLLRATRFELAKQMLSQNDLTISEISFSLGYSDLGNFSRSFKKTAGCSPQEYRLKIDM